MNEKKYKATVDGKEVDVEIIDGDKTYSPKNEFQNLKNNWKQYVPFIGLIFLVIVIIVLSITLFVWALPVLIPLFIIMFIVRMLAR